MKRGERRGSSGGERPSALSPGRTSSGRTDYAVRRIKALRSALLRGCFPFLSFLSLFIFFFSVLTNRAWRWRCEGPLVPPRVDFLSAAPRRQEDPGRYRLCPPLSSALSLGCDTITGFSPPPDKSLSSFSFFFYEPLFLPNNKQPLKRGLMWLLLPPLTANVLLFVHRWHSSP